METERGAIILELWSDVAINTVKNFVTLIQDGFYNGLKFHRVVPEFVIQGGDPLGNGTGGPGYAIPCETDGSRQKHVMGALSMAHAGRDTGGSQFFIVTNPDNTKHLDRKHTVFGQVIEGMEVIHSIRQGDKMLKVEMTEVDPAIEAHELKKLPSRR